MESEMANQVDPSVQIRFAFVEILFALTVAEIATQFGTLVAAHRELVGNPAAAYSHLVLAGLVVAASWVGWSESTAPGARAPVHSVFSLGFVVLLVDVALVIFYFILARGVEITRTKTGEMTVVASAANETFWVMMVFGGYLLWDVVTKAVSAGGSQRSLLNRLFGRELWKRGWVSAVCFCLAVLYWYLFNGVTCNFSVIAVDVGLLGIVLTFRALKQFATS